MPRLVHAAAPVVPGRSDGAGGAGVPIGPQRPARPLWSCGYAREMARWGDAAGPSDPRQRHRCRTARPPAHRPDDRRPTGGRRGGAVRRGLLGHPQRDLPGAAGARRDRPAQAGQAGPARVPAVRHHPGRPAGVQELAGRRQRRRQPAQPAGAAPPARRLAHPQAARRPGHRQPRDLLVPVGRRPHGRPRRARPLPQGRRRLHRRAHPGHAEAGRGHPGRVDRPRRAARGRVPWSVVNPDVSADLKDLSSTLESIEAVSDLPALRAEIADLSDQAGQPDLWNDPQAAQRVTSRLAHAQGDLRRLEDLRRRLEDLPVLYELAEDEGDQSAIADADAERASLRTDISALEVRTLLSGEYDPREALVTIRSEAGGVDAADFAEMLMRMYLRWAERHGYGTDVYDTSYAEEAGIKSATFAVHAPFAYGTLSVEQGTHRLVRISPFDNQGRRQTSFAGVEVAPVVESSDHVEIDEKELRVDVYRSSGPGGQGVNTTDSAVRITHLPTGIVVSCQNERPQIQNKASAMAVLQAKLLERRRQEEAEQMQALRGDGGRAWGTPIRNYVLYPYQNVKDVRTGMETGNALSVLDGEIDEFIDAEIRWMRQTGR